MTIVDIHCHTFNADDLPVRGFVQKVAFHDIRVVGELSRLVDMVIQGAAIGFEAENHKLDTLLTRALTPTIEAEAVSSAPLAPDLDQEVDALMAELDARDPALVRRVGTLMEGGDVVPGAAQPEGLGDWVSGARRAVRWAAIFAKDRLAVTQALVDNFAGDVDLFTPLLVDLEPGLGDVAPTTMHQQIVLQEKVSRLSMLGALPGTHQSHVHPFVGFDPRREVSARRAGQIETPLDAVRDAVERYGFVGVKMYPPMGFKPLGNTDGSVDEALRDLYRWCQAEDVPITVHCNPSNYAAEAFKQFSSPDLWRRVLTEFPELRLNLGHFGGASDKPTPKSGWPRKVAALMGRFPNLYADVGNHSIHDDEVRNTYLALLDELMAAHPVLAERVMFGSDWYMLAIQPDHDRFLSTYRTAYRQRFGTSRTNAFLGRNALRFLGFSDKRSKSAVRLTARYQAHAPANHPRWLAC